jgi:hypothetical protein
MYKRLPYLIPLLFLIAFAGSPQSPPQKDEHFSPSGQMRKPSQYSGSLVVGEFEAPPQSPQDAERRQIREKRYTSAHLSKKVADPGFLVDGKSETSEVRFIDYVAVAVGKPLDPSGMPASISTAIVVGTIISGKCFVTKDHTYVYTDYDVRVDQILKQDPGANLSVGIDLVAAREGGAVHFPSGHITNFLTVGHGLPEIGSQYILFLSRSFPSLPEYDIIFDAGYEIKNGRVYALDDVNSQYTGADVATFMDEVQKAILPRPGALSFLHFVPRYIHRSDLSPVVSYGFFFAVVMAMVVALEPDFVISQSA